ncbi:VCBS repeat-containing protein [candidate division KSB1 bacterium]|nr:VCBS repeat-containing protein [candidate division KSB1 bacterium]
MKRTVTVLLFVGLLLLSSNVFSQYEALYSNSENTGNDASNRITGIAVLSNNNFVMVVNRQSSLRYGLQKWTEADSVNGRGQLVTEWVGAGGFDVVPINLAYQVAIDTNGYAYVANNDENHNILVFDVNDSNAVTVDFRMETGAKGLYGIDVIENGKVFVVGDTLIGTTEDVRIYDAITTGTWATSHNDAPIATVDLPDGIYHGFAVAKSGSFFYVSEYESGDVLRYVGDPTSGYVLDERFNFSADSLAVGMALDESVNPPRLYICQDHLWLTTYEFGNTFVADPFTGITLDVINNAEWMFKMTEQYSGTGSYNNATGKSAGYTSLMDADTDEKGNLYLIHNRAWAMEKWTGKPYVEMQDWPLAMADAPDDSLWGDARSVCVGSDLDQDGHYEIIAPSYLNTGQIVVYEVTDNNTMEQVWVSPRMGSNYAYPFRRVETGDLDGDGKGEIIANLGRSLDDGAGIYIFQWDGVQGSDNYGTEAIASYQDPEVVAATDPRWVIEQFEVLDVDKDGAQELLIANNGANAEDFYVILSVTGNFESGFYTFNEELKIHARDGSHGGGSPINMMAGNFDGDEYTDILCQAWNNMTVFMLEATGPDTYVESSPVMVGEILSEAYMYIRNRTSSDDVCIIKGAVMDMDGDGTDEAFLDAYYVGWVLCFSGLTDVVNFSLDNVSVISTQLPLIGALGMDAGDVDGNGKPNLYAAGAGRGVFQLEFSGGDVTDPSQYAFSNIHEDTTQKSGDVFDVAAPKVDLDGDGKMELVCAVGTVTDSLKPVIKVLEATATGIKREAWTVIAPHDYKLEQNFPNPFNPTTTIEYYLPVDKKISLKIYNMLGQEVKILVNDEIKLRGRHKVTWDAIDNNGFRIASGRYLYVLKFGNFQISKQMTLLK